VPPSVLALSPRGELAALHEHIDRTDQVGALVLIYRSLEDQYC
jgi:hypothetical protein